MKPVRKVVFPVNGLGTRFLPATKAMPKEMLPVVDRPLIQHAVDEARAAGIEQFIFVTSRGKGALEDHFDHLPDLERTLRRYAVLGDDRILASYRQQLVRYRELLATHQDSIPDAEVYGDLEATLVWLDGLQDLRKARQEATSPRFTDFNELNQQLEVVTRSQVDDHVTRMRGAIVELKQQIWWVSGFVAGLSLLLVLLFTYLIIHPVRSE